MWTFIRYLIIGVYVGIATVVAFIFYYTSYSNNYSNHTKLSFYELRNWTKCDTWKDRFTGFENDPCSYFTLGKKKASSLSLTVLVMIEMFNSLNAVSENGSLFKTGIFRNPWLLRAIFISVLFHCLILYIPKLNIIFGTSPLNLYDWGIVILVSLPVLLVDEILKLVTRRFKERELVTLNDKKLD